MVKLNCSGNFRKTNSFFEKMLEIGKLGILDQYGRKGVLALKNNTPKDSGLVAQSWDYKITRENGSATITWTNSDVEGGCNIAILIQYGHGTKNGGFVQGRDFINPAIRPIFDDMANAVWEEVSNA